MGWAHSANREQGHVSEGSGTDRQAPPVRGREGGRARAELSRLGLKARRGGVGASLVFPFYSEFLFSFLFIFSFEF
jgi:hypothetical protein